MPSSCVMVTGDFNADISKESVFGDILLNYCNDNSLTLRDRDQLPSNSYTYVSHAWSTTSWLDHIVCTKDVIDSVTEIAIDYNCIISDHHPLACKLEIDVLPTSCSKSFANDFNHKLAWDKLSIGLLEKYRCDTSVMLNNNINVPVGLKCSNPNCTEMSHRKDIEQFYMYLVNALSSCGDKLVTAKHKSKSEYSVPGWNDSVAPYHNAARDAYKLWSSAGKPRNGALHGLMKGSRAKFKYALRKCKHNSNTILADKLASKYQLKNHKEFWRSIKSELNSKVKLPNSIDNCSGDQVPVMWKQHYESIFNCVPNSNCNDFFTNLCNSEHFSNIPHVTANEISVVIKSLSVGKAPGPDGLTAEHLKYAGIQLPVVLALLLTSIFVHGYLPEMLIQSVIVPIIKNKNKRISDKNNYRPIGLSNICTKIIESVLMKRMESCLTTTNNQFGFKSKHGTEMCVFVLKELIRYYTNHGSLMFVSFLDASKAFDRLNHTTLLSKLKVIGVPLYIIRIIAYWYCNQLYHIRWGQFISEGFYTSNGVRQGGVLSPLLFNIYMNDLSNALNNISVGCSCAGVTINHLMYADDLVVFAPSAKGLQRLMNVCTEYGQHHDVIYNCSKSQLMLFDQQHLEVKPNITLANTVLDYVDKYKYLGHVIDNQLNDEDDMKSKQRALYRRGNLLARKFYFCSNAIKVKLFSTYCNNIYLSTLWVKYRVKFRNIVCVAFNNVLRNLLNYNRRSSASQMFF